MPPSITIDWPGDVAGPWRGEERDQLGHVLRRPTAVQRDDPAHALGHRVVLRAQAAPRADGLDEARDDGVNGNPPAAKFHREVLDHLLARRLGRPEQAVSGEHRPCLGSGDVDDPPPVAEQPGGVTQRENQVEHGLAVGALGVARLGLEQRTQRGRGGVGHEHVQRAEFGANRGEHRLDVARIAEVGPHGDGTGAELLERPYGVLRSGFVTPVVHDARVAVPGERLVDRPPDSPRAAGYQREFLFRQAGPPAGVRTPWVSMQRVPPGQKTSPRPEALMIS